MIYISGPITNADPKAQDANLHEFNAAADKLRAAGLEVFNPAEQPPGLTYAQYMRTDILALLECKAMVQLPGWRESRGATIEHNIAVALDIPVRFFNDWEELTVQTTHGQAEDHNGDPICCCGWDPARALIPATSQVVAVRMITQHIKATS
ncbi:DUF4406 domain-containing protein [Arthrobacter sp. HY1533]|uniref:DUF4406 domain-containing protein n=1 Tax=Arthrobacter sp. HY1533 TaxID=2970919 RepID=UPI0022B9DDAA|nr:DUF4406 domain-containing protein [Arthrobacter sp. HY1533]